MRVLHLCSERGWRGGEQQVVYLIEGLLKNGVECVLAVKNGSALERYCIETKKSYYCVSFSNAIDFISAYKVRQICRKEKIDIIHLHSSKAHSVGVLAAWLGNTIPMVLSRRVFYALKNNRFSLWKYTHPRIRIIIGVSDKITDLLKAYVKGSVKCKTIYDGIDLDKFNDVNYDRNFLQENYSLEKQTTVIGITAALTAEKDHFTFINTIELLRQRQVAIHAFIIGDGPMRQELTEYVKSKNLNGVITFTGFQENVKPFLLSLDIFMMTSINEGLGSSILDAFLGKIPVVATAAGGIPELVLDNQTGFLCPIGDSAALAGNIQKLIDNIEVRNRLVSNAVDFVRNFSTERMTKQTLETYQDALYKD